MMCQCKQWLVPVYMAEWEGAPQGTSRLSRSVYAVDFGCHGGAVCFAFVKGSKAWQETGVLTGEFRAVGKQSEASSGKAIRQLCAER